MDRRFLTVLGVSLVFALVVSSIFYQISAKAGSATKKIDPVDMLDVVIAAKPLPIGVTVKPDDIKVTKIPASAFPKGAFSKPEEVIDRPVVSNVLFEEPILEGRLAARGAGVGPVAQIPIGMRAVSVRVNDVVGVAGFVLPGMRVDVLVTGRPPNAEGNNTVTRTVLQNITVLTAGQTLQADPRGQAINTPVVTLLVTPEQAETLTLAGNEAKIQLVLRSASDPTVSATRGQRMSDLYKSSSSGKTPRAGAGGGWSENEGGDGEGGEPRRPRPRPIVISEPKPVAPVALSIPQAPVDSVVVIRGNTKTVEVVGNGTAGASTQNQ
jgi:pilus assembly protein CpaB